MELGDQESLQNRLRIHRLDQKSARKNDKNLKNEIPDIGSVLHSSCFGYHPTIIVGL